MPGPPAEFTYKTVILVTGKSNIGKTTLCNFISNENLIKHISTDALFNPKVLIKDCSVDINSDEFYKFVIERSIKAKPKNIDIGRISPFINANLHVKFSDVVIKYIQKSFSDNNCKLLLLEGYTIGFNNVKKSVIEKLKQNNIVVWDLHKLH